MAEESKLDLSPREVAEKLEKGEIQLIDVREEYERKAGRIPSALHIELAALPSEADKIDRQRVVVFQCRSGGRSQMAAEAFRNSGYQAFNLAGGIKAWVESGLEIEGEVAEHGGS